ncbi:MAG: SBBP repeat-containing protein [Candidatus Zixiibacteriota bacterium]
MLKRHLFLSAIWVFAMFFCVLPAMAEMIVDTAWVRRYNGPGNSSDGASAIAVDGSGNVYVTGGSYGSGTDKDYATIKYYPNGDTAWVRRYNGPGNSSDGASAMAVDGSGNVYVTGFSYGDGAGADYATIKYLPNGDTAWVRRYDGPGNGEDQASAIALDDSGNAYVTGFSDGTGSYNYDYATIKYYPNGDTAWVRRYNGPGSGRDEAKALAVDVSGNVYVTGTSDGGGTLTDDYATVKYNPTGDTVWVRRYNGGNYSSDWATDLAIDEAGNVYVTGCSLGDPSSSGMSYATVKYNSLGEFLWVRRYRGEPASSDDRAFACGVDPSGNVYVTGEGNDGGNYDYVTIKYNASGDRLWVRAYNGPGNVSDFATDLAVDVSGNVFVTGYSAQNSYSPYNDDYATVGYNPHGDTLWVRRYNGPGDAEDGASALVIDNSNNVYVTGGSNGYVAGSDYATIKYFQALRGDANRDRVIDAGDVVYLINYLFKEGPAPMPVLRVGDCTCDGVVNAGDVVYLINYLFKSGPPPSC